MEPSLHTIAQDRILSWSDANVGGFDLNDYHPSMLPPRSPSWANQYRTTHGQPIVNHSNTITDASSTSTSMTARHPLNGQLSPISTSMDGPPGPATDESGCSSAADATHAHPVPQSASSTITGSWSLVYGDHEDAHATHAIGDEDAHWEHGSDDELAIPKVEPMDEDVRLDQITEAPPTPVPSNTSPTTLKPKRPRGRPRKHPVTPVVTANKITKGRSKTGCLTCRKRKKKCDEAKPRCMNCEKNAVVCEGYPEKQIWKSGKDKAGEGHSHSASLPVITLQPMFQGLENAEDMIFWKHYHVHLSSILTVEGEHKNAFKEILMPIATKHQGLMHSLLALSSKHLDFETPYGLKILKDNPNTSLEALQQRSDHHHEKAMEKFYEDIVRSQSADTDAPDPSARYGQMMCFLLENLAEGTPRGEHRVHLGSYQRLIQDSPPRDPAFLSFITEFFQYHIFADELIRFPDMHTPRLASEDWTSFTPIHPPRLLGVADGLFKYLCQITSIRNTIRSNIANGVDPAVDYTSLYRAAQIEQEIRSWQPSWPPGDSRDRVSLLYQQMLWTYLLRTIYPPSPMSPPPSATHSLGHHSSFHAGSTNTPPISGHSSSCSSPSIRPRTSASTPHPQPMRRHTITNYTPQPPPPSARHHHHSHSLDSNNHHHTDSPPPFRQPSDLDERIPHSVEECLAILDSFKPSDPSQKLLLIPCLVIGTLCFTPEQQERIRRCIRTVKGYTGLRNSERVSELLEEVWRCMERGEWGRVWDWQGIAKSMGCDALCC